MSGEAESDDAGTFGNRPAAGARLVDNAADLPNSFGGGQEATDFLGLSQDLAGFEPGAPEAEASRDSGASGAIGPGFGVAPAPESDASASWLLSPTEQPESESKEESEAELEGVEELAPIEAGRSRRILSLAAAVLVIGAAVTIAMKLGDHSKTTGPELLTVNHPPVVHKPTPTPLEHSSSQGSGSSVGQGILPNGETDPVTETPTETETDPTIPEVGTSLATIVVEPAPPPRAAAHRLAEWMSRNGWSPISLPGPDASAPDESGIETPAPTSPVGWSATALLAFATRSPVAMPPGDAVEPSTAGTPTAGESLPPVSVISFSGDTLANPSATSMSRSSGAVPAGALRMASSEDLAGIWNSDVVPMNLLDAETRVVTPGVGSVRVVLKTGEIFDGRLYAVGQGQVWLEMDIGRLALSAQSVLRIDQSFSDKDAKAVDALPRMRVRTPGGLFFGKVLSRDEHHVTLRLEGGGRITLESTDIEPAPLGDTRVIGPEKP